MSDFYVKYKILKDVKKQHVYILFDWWFKHIHVLLYDLSSDEKTIPEQYIDFQYFNSEIVPKYPSIFCSVTRQIVSKCDVKEYAGIELESNFSEFNACRLKQNNDGRYIFETYNKHNIGVYSWMCLDISIVKAVQLYLKGQSDNVLELLNSYKNGTLNVVENFAKDISKFIFNAAEKYLSDLLQFVNNSPYEKSARVESFSEEFMEKSGSILAETILVRDSHKKLKSA
jgi:hypothetical protein